MLLVSLPWNLFNLSCLYCSDQHWTLWCCKDFLTAKWNARLLHRSCRECPDLCNLEWWGCFVLKKRMLLMHTELMIHFDSQISFNIPEVWTNFPSSSWFVIFFLSGYLCIYPQWISFVHFRLSLQGSRSLLMILIPSLWVLVTSPSLGLLENHASSYSTQIVKSSIEQTQDKQSPAGLSFKGPSNPAGNH